MAKRNLVSMAVAKYNAIHESRIRQAIENLGGDLTVLIISHRLPTLEHADHIIVMGNGQLKRKEPGKILPNIYKGE